MTRKNLEEALNLLSANAAAGAESPSRKKKIYIKPAVVAACLAVVLCGAAAAAQAGGLIDVKNIFGTVTGQEYVGDASEDFIVSVLRLGANGIELSVEKTDPTSKIDFSNSVITALSYSVSDSDGNTVITAAPDEKFLSAIPAGYTPTDDRADLIEKRFSGTDDGGVEYTVVVTHRRKYVNPNAVPDMREVFFTESEETLRSGVYTLHLESFRVSSKGDQDLDVSGSWTAEFTV